MAQQRGMVTLAGFLLAGLGFLSIIVSMIGLKFSFLVWLDAPGALFGFVIKIVMILAGFVIIYLAQSSDGLMDED